MPEQQENKRIFSLLEVTQSIQKTLAERYTSTFWVKAEMNKLNYYPHSGHCYPDLVEKQDGRIIAQLRSTLWKDDYLRINKNFLEVVKTPLKDGIKMLFSARITFDPAHGLALRIIDIDPVFSLGELEREKQESIDRLKQEGVFDANKLLTMPILPQRIAVISVQTSKGYADFLKVMDGNEHGFKFFHLLFPSLLQGEKAVESILWQLHRIRKVLQHFDVVAIVRGGGGEVGLASFNNVELARAICLFPLPVITGIGHATNETVVEMVSHKNAITPTALANYLVERFLQYQNPLNELERKLIDLAQQSLRREQDKVATTGRYFRSVTDNILLRNQHSLDGQTQTVIHASRYRIQQEREQYSNLVYQLRKDAMLFCNQCSIEIREMTTAIRKDISMAIRTEGQAMDNFERTVRNLDPIHVLKRGFSITRKNGKVVKTVEDVQPGDRLETEFPEGKVISEVKSKNQKDL
jgi:exodeoxyribonuclease VII large subunit